MPGAASTIRKDSPSATTCFTDRANHAVRRIRLYGEVETVLGISQSGRDGRTTPMRANAGRPAD